MIHKLIEWLPARLSYGRPINWSIAKDFKLTGCETHTRLGWTARHLISITYSRKDHMRSFYVTLFFVVLGVGWTVTPKPAKPY